MWFIHMYAQFGFLALLLTIHVSDQPVEPSAGLMPSTLVPSPFARLIFTCQVVPSTVPPDLSDATCLR